ncbi:MAG: MiaB/RimO family radical SAM methylthiotransferase [Lachnospiraceae bacterium]|nr:MiaB/RimO family radical SAM methylthiotransferase [Lachnospiraceae bacterium]
MKNVALHNLGCKVNSYEIDVVAQKLQENGYTVVPFDEKADIYVVNTCTVTNIADRKSRQMLHRAKKQNPEAVVVAIGCYVQSGKDAIEMDDCIDLAIGNNKKGEIVQIIEAYLKERGLLSGEKVDKTLHDTTVLDLNNTYEYEEMTLKKTTEHTRAYIKIQDGCNQFCSYCIIPYARGRVRSRKAEDVLSEVRGIVAAGYQEIVLTGIHISSYGIDFEEDAWREGKSVEALKSEGRHDYSGRSKLIDLIELIHEIPGLSRIRIGSFEPRIVTEEFCRRLSALPKVCPHFHLSLQSGCDETLKRMNRHYTTEEYLRSVKNLRDAFERPAITTDVIVGFPQESEEEFAKTVDYLEEIRFYEMHVFKYSKRQGTRAADMPEQVPDQIKTKRSNVLLEMEKRQSGEYREYYIGKEAEVLFEEAKVIDGVTYQVGHTRDYVKVALKTEENLANTLTTVQVQGFLSEEILVALKFTDK